MHTATSSYLPIPARRQNTFFVLTEVVLTLVVCALLAWLAQPLALSGLDSGLGQRYDISLAPQCWLALWTSTPDLFSRLGDDSRAVLLLRTASVWLPAFGLFGLGLLHIARCSQRWSGALLVVLLGAAAAEWRPFGWPVAVGLAGGLFGLCLLLLTLPTRSGVQHAPLEFRSEPTGIWSSLVWPGWVLLTGLGWLWIADFAARGPVAAVRPGAKYFGLHQADAIFLANAILLLAAAKSDSLLRTFARLVSALGAMWQRPRGPLVLLALGGTIAFGLGWLGHRVRPPLPLLQLAGGGMPHISGELLRLFAAAALAWVAYRFGEWHSSNTRLMRGLVGSVAVGMLCLFGLGVSGDMGPILILALTLLLLVAAPAVKLATLTSAAGRSPRTRVVAAVVLGVAVLVSGSFWLWRTALTNWAPLVSHTAALREAAREDPFGANSPNLAQAHWLMDAARIAGGFGLGRVPYCGAKAHIETTACTLGSGAPIQLASDFAFAGLASTWGMVGAAGCIALLFAWLRAVTLAGMPPRLSAPHSVPGLQHKDKPLNWLRAWLVAVPCLMAQAQIMVSVGGALLWTSLTGVTLPLLGYGSVALCVTALWVGLAMRPHSGRAAV